MFRLIRLNDDDDDNKPGCYLVSAFWALVGVLLIKMVWPSAIPFSLFQFWTLEASVWDLLVMSWPLFAFGFFANLIALAVHADAIRRELWSTTPEDMLVSGAKSSLFAGVMEEIAFRWILFYSEIWWALLLNWLFFGFLGFGLGEWIFNVFFGPLANFFTLGYLEPYLYSEYGWAVGAAIIGSNGQFRDGHAYQGWVGKIFAWFAGMWFFYLMFQYGLFAAMIVHFAFDLMVDLMVYVTALSVRR